MIAGPSASPPRAFGGSAPRSGASSTPAGSTGASGARDPRRPRGGRALLLLGWYGYDDPASPRLRGTWRRIRQRLSPAPGLLSRYEPSAPAGEGAFGICSAWAVEYLARGGGSVEEAVAWLEGLLARANDVGLFAEEIDPRTGGALGNFPQAFTHVGVVNAVLTLDRRVRAEQGRREAPVEARP